jgi:hypothetical protein
MTYGVRGFDDDGWPDAPSSPQKGSHADSLSPLLLPASSFESFQAPRGYRACRPDQVVSRIQDLAKRVASGVVTARAEHDQLADKEVWILPARVPDWYHCVPRVLSAMSTQPRSQARPVRGATEAAMLHGVAEAARVALPMSLEAVRSSLGGSATRTESLLDCENLLTVSVVALMQSFEDQSATVRIVWPGLTTSIDDSKASVKYLLVVDFHLHTVMWKRKWPRRPDDERTSATWLLLNAKGNFVASSLERASSKRSKEDTNGPSALE